MVGEDSTSVLITNEAAGVSVSQLICVDSAMIDPVEYDETDSAIALPPKFLDKPLPQEISNGVVSSNGDDSRKPASERETSLCCSTFKTLINRKFICDDMKFTIISLIFTLVPIVLYIADFITDWLNAFGYWNRRSENRDNVFYFGLTLFVIIFPSIVMQIFSAYWEIEATQERRELTDETTNGRRYCYCMLMTTLHIFQIAPVYRYLRAAYYGLKSTQYPKDEKSQLYYYKKCYSEVAKVNIIKLMESFLEAGPQLVLQLYIMITTLDTPVITVISCCLSLFGMAMGPVTYERALRITLSKEKEQLSIIGSIVMFLYRAFNITSRVFALALLLHLHFLVWIGLFVLHWLVMSFFIIRQKTQFCGAATSKEIFYDFTIGFFYCFDYFNVRSNDKCKPICFYTVMFIEDTAILLVWYFFRHGSGLLDIIMGELDSNDDPNMVTSIPHSHHEIPDDLAIILVSVTATTFILGILLVSLYYFAFHPTRNRFSIKEFFAWKHPVKRETSISDSYTDLPPPSHQELIPASFETAV